MMAVADKSHGAAARELEANQPPPPVETADSKTGEPSAKGRHGRGISHRRTITIMALAIWTTVAASLGWWTHGLFTGNDNPPTPAALIYAAIAVDKQTGIVANSSGTTVDAAQQSAERGCRDHGGGPGCQAVVWWTNGSASFGSTVKEGLGITAWGVGWDEGLELPNTAADRAVTQVCSSCQISLRLSEKGTQPFDAGSFAPMRGYKLASPSLDSNSPADLYALSFTSNDPRVFAIKPGTVVYSGLANASAGIIYGNAVVVYHDQGLYSVYAHLDPTAATATVGEHVDNFTVIGEVSSDWCKGQSDCDSRLLLSVRRGPTPAITDEAAAYVGSTDFSDAVQLPW